MLTTFQIQIYMKIYFQMLQIICMKNIPLNYFMKQPKQRSKMMILTKLVQNQKLKKINKSLFIIIQFSNSDTRRQENTYNKYT